MFHHLGFLPFQCVRTHLPLLWVVWLPRCGSTSSIQLLESWISQGQSMRRHQQSLGHKNEVWISMMKLHFTGVPFFQLPCYWVFREYLSFTPSLGDFQPIAWAALHLATKGKYWNSLAQRISAPGFLFSVWNLRFSGYSRLKVDDRLKKMGTSENAWHIQELVGAWIYQS